MSRHLCFQEPSHLVVDNWDACLTDSETSWFRRYQTGGGSEDALKEFLNVLMRVLLEGHKHPDQTREECQMALQPLVSEDFHYNGHPSSPHLICQHLLHLFDTFPTMDVAVNMFRDSTTHTGIFLILVSGRMEGAWLNQPASNKQEHLALTLHVEATLDGSKVQKVSFRSEFLSPHCYQAIRALDLVFTAFSLHQKQKTDVESPIKLVALLDRRDEPKRFEEELREAEVEYKQERNLVPPPIADIIAQEKEPRRVRLSLFAEEASSNDTKNKLEILKELEEPENAEEAQEIIDLMKKEVLSPGEVERVLALQNKVAEDERKKQEGGSSFWNKKKDSQDASNLITEEELIRVMRGGAEPVPTLVTPLSSPPPVQPREQQGGNGYSVAVEQVPVAGQPVYQGYSTCCPPYFTTDGTDYDVDGYPQRGGKKNSPALRDYFQQVVKRMSDVTHPKESRLHRIVSQNVSKTMRILGPRMKHSPSKRLLSQEGGSVLGSLGTLIFPQGTVATVTPFLLILGAKLAQKISQDQKKEKPLKKKEKKSYKRLPAKKRDLPTLSKTSRPMTNAQIRRIMRKKRGGDCAQHLCGDASLRPFGDCLPPTWGPKYF